MNTHEVRHVVTNRDRYYFCDECNTSYPTKLMATEDHSKLKVKIEIIEVDMRKNTD